MKANELRIGNWVKRSTQPDGFQIESHSFVVCERDPSMYEPIPLTEEWLVRFGFKEMPITKWFGNGADWQDPNSFTEQKDYALSGFIIRYEYWSYRKNEDSEYNTDLSHSIHTGKWYEKCYEYVSCPFPDYIHSLQNLYFALTGEELTLK